MLAPCPQDQEGEGQVLIHHRDDILLAWPRQQLKQSLDEGITPIEHSGARGVLFKATKLAYGYTFVSKGTVSAFIPDLEHESATEIPNADD